MTLTYIDAPHKTLRGTTGIGSAGCATGEAEPEVILLDYPGVGSATRDPSSTIGSTPSTTVGLDSD